MCVPEVAEELPPTDVGEEHVEAVGVLEAPGQRHNEGVAHLPDKYNIQVPTLSTFIKIN